MLPRAEEAERAVLGAILIDSSILDKVALETDDFYNINHRDIYQTMRMIGGDLDYLMLTEALERAGRLDDIGGGRYILSLINDCPSAYNYEAYVKLIQDTSTRRRIVRCAEDLAKSALNENSHISDAVSSTITDLIKSIRMTEGAVSSSGYLREIYEKAEERAENPKEIYGLQTGLCDFDKITHGLQKGEQFVLSGAPGTGKSLLAFQLACGMAEHGHAGAVYELEMSGTAVWRRHISSISKIPTHEILSGIGMNNKWDEFAKAIKAAESLPIYLSEESNWTTVKMRADLARLKQKHNIEWFIVDYMGLLADNYGSDDTERQQHISHQLRAITKDLRLASLTLQSVTKAGYSRPTMANVSGPTAIHHDADQIAILSKNEDIPNVVELRWEKMREADRSGLIKLVKEPGLPTFHSYIPSSENEKYNAPSWVDW